MVEGSLRRRSVIDQNTFTGGTREGASIIPIDGDLIASKSFPSIQLNAADRANITRTVLDAVANFRFPPILVWDLHPVLGSRDSMVDFDTAHHLLASSREAASGK